MIYKYLYIVLCLIVFISCSSEKSFVDETPRMRVFEEWKGSSFHKPIELKIGWFKYKENEIKEGKPNEWSISMEDSGTTFSASPILMLNYPDSADAIYFDMDIDDELLGKLIKRSLMTQIPIKRPFKEFLKLQIVTVVIHQKLK